MDDNEISRTELAKQRRFLVLVSLVVIAVPILRVSIEGSATFSGVSIHFGRPEYVSVSLLTIWLWALLRYYTRFRQRLHQINAAITTEHRIIEGKLRDRWARRRAQAVANEAGLNRSSYGKLAVSRNLESPVPPEGITRYECVFSIPGKVVAKLWFEMPPSVFRRTTMRAWISLAFNLPAVSEHLAPFFIATGAAIAFCAGFDWPWNAAPPTVEPLRFDRF